jgi:hypothetical protein
MTFALLSTLSTSRLFLIELRDEHAQALFVALPVYRDAAVTLSDAALFSLASVLAGADELAAVFFDGARVFDAQARLLVGLGTLEFELLFADLARSRFDSHACSSYEINASFRISVLRRLRHENVTRNLGFSRR